MISLISRALCALFNSPALTGKIASRGGTAIPGANFASNGSDGLGGRRPSGCSSEAGTQSHDVSLPNE